MSLDRFYEACETSLARLSSVEAAKTWLAVRWGIDGDSLRDYAREYGGDVVANIDEARLKISRESIAEGAFVGGFLIALEMVGRREASRS